MTKWLMMHEQGAVVQRVFGRVIALANQHRMVIVVLATFLVSALILPTLSPIATTDDWGYTRSVETLYHEGQLAVFPVFPVVAATAVFQVVWGWGFALLFGMTVGVMRVSTLAMVCLGAVALYGLLHELKVDWHRSALGVVAYLFNPLSFVLAYTFMTDPHFTSLLIIATFFYVRGLRVDGIGWRATIIGSGVAALAFLVRQQGALVPFAAVVYLLATRQLRPNRAGA